jgi:hypothetical protein
MRPLSSGAFMSAFHSASDNSSTIKITCKEFCLKSFLGNDGAGDGMPREALTASIPNNGEHQDSGLLHRSQPKPFRFRACAMWRLTFFSTQGSGARTPTAWT